MGSERIKELLDQTDIPQFPLFENLPPAWVASDYDMEKFAELIVRECSESCTLQQDVDDMYFRLGVKR